VTSVDPTVVVAGNGIVGYLDDEPVGTVQIERKLLDSVGLELVTASLREGAELLEVGRRQNLGEPQRDLRCSLSTVRAAETLRVIEQPCHPMAAESNLHALAPRSQLYTKLVYASKVAPVRFRKLCTERGGGDAADLGPGTRIHHQKTPKEAVRP